MEPDKRQAFREQVAHDIPLCSVSIEPLALGRHFAF
jgi:hypothetical protein